MAFRQLFETNAQEVERLSQAHPESIYGLLAPLPVINAYPTPGQLVSIQNMNVHAPDPRCIGVVLDQVARRTSVSDDSTLPRRFDASYGVRIIASTHPDHFVEGSEICVSEAQLRRSRALTPQELLSL